MKKTALIILSAAALSISTAVQARDMLKYVKSDEEYDYGSEYVYVACEKLTGKIIPLSIGPLDGYSYAYLPGDGEIEIKKIKPVVFSDISMEWGGDLNINELSARGVFTGFEDGTFQKDRVLTRAEMAAIFSRMFDVTPKDGNSSFSDISSSDWFCGYVNALSELGVYVQDENFNPDNPATREQLIQMTFRMLSELGYIEKNDDYDFSMYPDFNDVSDFAKSGYNGLLSNKYNVIYDMIENDFMDTADDEFYLLPQKPVTRYECAQFLYMFIRNFTDNNAPAIRIESAPDIEIPILDGSTSTYDITKNIYSQFYQNYGNYPDFPQAHSKTSNSYKRLIDKEVDMIFVPDPSDDIKNYAEEKGVELQYIPIAYEAMIFFTSDQNKANNITTHQLQDIYIANAINNWKEMDGDNAELVAFCRNNDSGSHAQMEKFILNGSEINEAIKKEHTSWLMSSILTEVDDYNKEHPGKYAIGYSLYYYYYNIQSILGPLNLKLLNIDDVEPTEENIKNGTYPYTTNYYAVIRNEDNPKVDAFAKLMQGDFGKEIVKISGFGVID